MPFDEETGLFVSQDWKEVIKRSQERFEAENGIMSDQSGQIIQQSHAVVEVSQLPHTLDALTVPQSPTEVTSKTFGTTFSTHRDGVQTQHSPPHETEEPCEFGLNIIYRIESPPIVSIPHPFRITNQQNEAAVYDSTSELQRLAINPDSIVIETFAFANTISNPNGRNLRRKPAKAGIGLFFGPGSRYNYQGDQSNLFDYSYDAPKAHALALAVEAVSGIWSPDKPPLKYVYPCLTGIVNIEKEQGRKITHVVIRTDSTLLAKTAQSQEIMEAWAAADFKRTTRSNTRWVPNGQHLKRLYEACCLLRESGVVVTFEAGGAESFVGEAYKLAQEGAALNLEDGKKAAKNVSYHQPRLPNPQRDLKNMGVVVENAKSTTKTEETEKGGWVKMEFDPWVTVELD